VLKRLFGGKPTIAVHVLVKGRIGEGWFDVDQTVRVRPGITLGEFIEEASARRIPLREAIANSPHLAHTLMLNGERCPVEPNADRVLDEGDEIYLLAPLAGG